MLIVSGVVLKLYGLNFIDEVFKKVLEKIIEDNRSANPFVIAERNNIAIIYSVLPEKILGRTLVHDELKIIIMNDRIKKTQERYAVVTYLLYQILAKKGIHYVHDHERCIPFCRKIIRDILHRRTQLYLCGF